MLRTFHPPKTAKNCRRCSRVFMPRVGGQVYCDPCHTPCIGCGGKKDVRGDRCKRCEYAGRIGRANPRNRRSEEPLANLIDRIESAFLAPTTAHAFGYVVGVMFGDGCISPVVDLIKYRCADGTITVHRNTSHRPRLAVTSEGFAQRFADRWNALTGRRVRVQRTTRSNFSSSTLKGLTQGRSVELFMVAPRHAPLGRYLHNLKYTRGADVALAWPIDAQRGFVEGMSDSEGYVSPSGYLDIANKDKSLLQVVSKMLGNLGYPARIYHSPSQAVSHLRTKPLH